MDIDKFFSMTDKEFNQIISVPAKKSSNLTGRKFNVIGYRNGETKTVENVGRNTALKIKAELKADGFNRVDMIEIHEFAKQIFAAANEKFQPEIMVEPKKETQQTIAWEVIAKGEDAWLDNRPITKVADRNAKNKVAQKRAAIFAKINAKAAPIETMKIFNRLNGNFLFASNGEKEIVKYLKENNLSATDVILYIPTETFNALRGMENE